MSKKKEYLLVIELTAFTIMTRDYTEKYTFDLSKEAESFFKQWKKENYLKLWNRGYRRIKAYIKTPSSEIIIELD